MLLAPSVVEEAAGRVAAEALVNGIPCIASDRGGLAETLNGGGFVLPLAAGMTPESATPPDAAAVEEWLALILRLHDDAAFYGEACERATLAAGRYGRTGLTSKYAEFFDVALRSHGAATISGGCLNSRS